MNLFTTRSPEETEAAGYRFALSLGPGAVVALYGDLGSGKTCFVRGAVRALGVTGPVKSPTYSLVNPYSGDRPVYHWDAYRIGVPKEVEEAGLEECLEAGGVLFVEWAERIEPLLPPDARRISFKITGETSREIIYK